MVAASTGENWPAYHPGQREETLALGVIALNYGQLENLYRTVFAYVTGMNEFQAAALFHRLPNNHRKDVLYDLMAKTTLPTELKKLVQYFAAGFGACADNRHDIMHSASGGRHISTSKGTSGILLSKYTKAGNKLQCYATVELLRSIADEIHAYAVFGSKIAGAVSDFRSAQDHGRVDDFLRTPSPKKPPPPARMNWRSPGQSKASSGPAQ